MPVAAATAAEPRDAATLPSLGGPSGRTSTLSTTATGALASRLAAAPELLLRATLAAICAPLCGSAAVALTCTRRP
eukprot:CAMPEP_0202893600 /NCGR_PEP_ID=MMETSP1392-20130828/3157_1 /ASSEMBLY_ACC=CAM_ASM_000868 /TAXON_ID=225041 /ORGANISM="Chlamydomonas chlamydogama, Strain SAG 11-48b" /LENGTH=75 /DNA_ID=CAMNT_0049577993 /DNA_START=2793 /DNA_END=3016 /DNA_ORIENTATION=+